MYTSSTSTSILIENKRLQKQAPTQLIFLATKSRGKACGFQYIMLWHHVTTILAETFPQRAPAGAASAFVHEMLKQSG